MPAHNFKLLFFYFRYNMESSADSVFRELLHQFCSGGDQIPSAVEDITTRYDSTSEMPSIDDLLVVFRSVIKESKDKVIVVIDALDECSLLLRDDMLNALRSFSEANIPNLYFFISSRPERDIHHAAGNSLHIHMTSESQGDIKHYIVERISIFSDLMSINERTELKWQLLEKSEGM
jgi:hypothetical protein